MTDHLRRRFAVPVQRASWRRHRSAGGCEGGFERAIGGADHVEHRAARHLKRGVSEGHPEHGAQMLLVGIERVERERKRIRVSSECHVGKKGGNEGGKTGEKKAKTMAGKRRENHGKMAGNTEKSMQDAKAWAERETWRGEEQGEERDSGCFSRLWGWVCVQ